MTGLLCFIVAVMVAPFKSKARLEAENATNSVCNGRWIFALVRDSIWLQLHVRRFPGRNRMPGDRSLALLRARARGQRGGERFIRTLKESLLWARPSDTIEELRTVLVEFANRYNETWLVARHGHRIPTQLRDDQCRLDQNATTD